MDHNIFSKIWKTNQLYLHGWHLRTSKIKQRVVMIVTDFLLLCITIPLNDSDSKNSLVWIGNTIFLTILQLLNDLINVLIKRNKPSMVSINTFSWIIMSFKLYFLCLIESLPNVFNEMVLRWFKMSKCVRYCDYFLRRCRSFQFKHERMVILNLGQESIFRILFKKASSFEWDDFVQPRNC